MVSPVLQGSRDPSCRGCAGGRCCVSDSPKSFTCLARHQNQCKKKKESFAKARTPSELLAAFVAGGILCFSRSPFPCCCPLFKRKKKSNSVSLADFFLLSLAIAQSNSIGNPADVTARFCAVSPSLLHRTYRPAFLGLLLFCFGKLFFFLSPC